MKKTGKPILIILLGCIVLTGILAGSFIYAMDSTSTKERFKWLEHEYSRQYKGQERSEKSEKSIENQSRQQNNAGFHSEAPTEKTQQESEELQQKIEKLEEKYEYIEAENQIDEGYLAIYEEYFAGQNDSFIKDYDAKGNSRVIFHEDNQKVEYLVYDRDSQNGACAIYVYYHADKQEDGSWYPSESTIITMYAYVYDTGEVIDSGRKAWSDTGSEEYREKTGE